MYKFLVLSALVAIAAADVSHLFRKPVSTFSTPFTNVRQYPTYTAPVVAKTVYTPVAPAYVAAKTYTPTHQGHVAILKQSQDLTPEGNYHYDFQSENGINVEQSASLRQVGPNVAPAVQGSYSYTSPEGEVVSVKYVADENGYQAEGSHIPTPPPVPAAILRSLDWIAAHPYKEDTVVVGRRTNPYY